MSFFFILEIWLNFKDIIDLLAKLNDTLVDFPCEFHRINDLDILNVKFVTIVLM